MKCAYHPQKEAVNKCGMCQKPLCEECGEAKVGANVLCSRCAALSAAQAAMSGEGDRWAEHEAKKSAAGGKKKKPHVAMTVVIILSVIVILANVYMYMGPKTPAVTEFDPYEDPLVAATLIDGGIEDYATDHGGQFPAKLSDLLGKYLPYKKMTSAVLNMFSYTRFSPTSYALRFKDEDNEEYSDIVFGKEDK